MSGDGKICQISTEEEFSKLISSNDGKLIVIHFKSDWSESCKQMTASLLEMKGDEAEYPGVEYAEIDAESLPTVSLKYAVNAVPTVLLFLNGTKVERIDGLRTARLINYVKTHVMNPISSSSSVPVPEPIRKETSESIAPKEPLEERLKKLVNRHELMVFMKGNPSAPRCGFSNTLMSILKETGLPFDTFDILQDDEVRQGLKSYSNWQTYPQVYVKGELVGGLDIIKDLKESGELVGTLKGEI